MQQRRSIRYSIATFVWLLVVMYSLFMPASEISVPDDIMFKGADKMVHFVLFATMTFLVVMAMREREIGISIKLTLLLMSTFAILTELFQLLISDRNCDIWDVIADIAGVVVVLLITKNTR